MIRFAFVVATRNRHEDLIRFVNSLRRQKGINIAALAVVDQSDPEKAERNRAFLSVVQDIPILYQRDEEVGLSRARNLGLRRVYERIGDVLDSAYIAFPDDDCVYPEGFLEGIVDLIRTNPSYEFFAVPYGDETGVAQRFPKISQSVSLWNVFYVISSVGLFVRATAMEGVFFDEKIGSGTSLPAGEEVDLTIRLLARGLRGLYEPMPVVYHKVARFNTVNLVVKASREEANAYIIARAARNVPSLALRSRLGARLAKDIIKWWFVDKDTKLIIAKRLKGYRWGWSERLPE